MTPFPMMTASVVELNQIVAKERGATVLEPVVVVPASRSVMPLPCVTVIEAALSL